ncbi:hypothetical protein N7444_013616 [Penicillium canescens]|nr:hypothetical protein N7444_013616 [Penicillium canescens]
MDFITAFSNTMADQPTIRLATPEDVPLILQFICELADYEKALHEVEATEESLLSTLSFPDTPPKRGAVYTALITPLQPRQTPPQSPSAWPSTSTTTRRGAPHRESTWRIYMCSRARAATGMGLSC